MHRQWINNQLVIVDCRVGQLRGRLPPIAHIPHRAKPLAVVEFDANESPELISVDKVKAALDGEWSSSYSIEGNYVRAIDGSVFTLKYRYEEKFVIECERFGRGTVDQTLVRLEWDNGDVWDRVPHCISSTAYQCSPKLHMDAGMLEIRVNIPLKSASVAFENYDNSTDSSNNESNLLSITNASRTTSNVDSTSVANRATGKQRRGHCERP